MILPKCDVCKKPVPNDSLDENFCSKTCEEADRYTSQQEEFKRKEQIIQNQITMSDLRKAAKYITEYTLNFKKEKPNFDHEILWTKAKEFMRERMWNELYKDT